MIAIGKTFSFEAAHYLPGHEKCGSIHGHGFHGKIEIIGEIQDNGMVLDFSILNQIIQEKIIKKFDHKCINDVPPFNNHISPTVENLLIFLKERIENVLPKNIKLYKLEIWETLTSYAIWKGENYESK